MLRTIRKLHQFLVDHPIKPGEIIHRRYQVEKIIGKGSYGILYRCQDIQTAEVMVIKQLRPSKRKNLKEIKQFRKEAEIIKKLNHSHIPKFVEAFAENEHYFYVMSYIDADNLDEAIFSRKKTFNEEESLLFVRDLIKIIEHLHEKKIFHLDLRIPNILIRNHKPYLIDFGLAIQEEFSSSAHEEELKLQDYYDLGDILLYLLYTTYSSKKKKALPWTEELDLKKETIFFLKRLLRIGEPYENLEDIKKDLEAAIMASELT